MEGEMLKTNIHSLVSCFGKVLAPPDDRMSGIYDLAFKGWFPPVSNLESRAGAATVKLLPAIKDHREGGKIHPILIPGLGLA